MILLRSTLLFACLASCACSQPDDSLPPIPQNAGAQEESDLNEPVSFQQDRAFADLEYLVNEIGPRRIGTKGAQKTRDWLSKELKAHGWEITTESFEAVPPPGARRTKATTGVNLYATRPGTLPGEIWIATHYDTFDFPGFVGANDGGSSTAVLAELGRVWGQTPDSQSNEISPREGYTLVLAFFDGEERFPPNRWDDFKNSTFGSRHAVELRKEAKTLQNIKAFLLLDMVGDIDLNLYLESSSAQWLVSIMERTAHAIGDPRLFVGRREIKDDHIHFRRAGVPCINLIDFQYGPGHRWWHTREDNLEHVSAESLGRTGRLVVHALPEMERAALKRNR